MYVSKQWMLTYIHTQNQVYRTFPRTKLSFFTFRNFGFSYPYCNRALWGKIDKKKNETGLHFHKGII